MRIKTLVLGPLNTNTYLLEYENDVLVIDPAGEAGKIVRAAEGKNISYVLLTHGHFDHCNAAKELQEGGAKVLMSRVDYTMIVDGNDLSRFCNVVFNSFVPDEFIEEGDYDLGGHAVRVLSTPGHTAGSLTYLIENKIFCGDTLFYCGVGRSDLPTGDKRRLTRSIEKLYGLQNGEVFPGHGDKTSLEFEMENNPYVKKRL